MSKVIETLDPDGRRVLDVSDLPTSANGSREPVWWGNTLLMFIETTTLVLLVVSYFYLRRNFDGWPPPQPNRLTPLFEHANWPDLLYPTIELVLMLLSIIPMHFTDRAALRQNARGVNIGLSIMFVIAAAMIAMRFLQMQPTHLKFRWDENAYGSIIWVILGTHLTYLVAAAAEFFIMAAWVMRHGIDFKHGLDVELAGIYWYWVVATWVVCYMVVYFGPRWL